MPPKVQGSFISWTLLLARSTPPTIDIRGGRFKCGRGKRGRAAPVCPCAKSKKKIAHGRNAAPNGTSAARDPPPRCRCHRSPVWRVSRRCAGCLAPVPHKGSPARSFFGGRLLLSRRRPRVLRRTFVLRQGAGVVGHRGSAALGSRPRPASLADRAIQDLARPRLDRRNRF